MKKIITFACAIIITATSFATDINISDKAQKAFETTFTDARNVVWSAGENNYTVQFTQQGVFTYATYDEDGTFISSRRYYQHEKLPTGILHRLQKRFSGKTVFGVTEITVADSVFYFIKLEDAATWTSIRIDNEGDIEVLDTFKKL